MMMTMGDGTPPTFHEREHCIFCDFQLSENSMVICGRNWGGINFKKYHFNIQIYEKLNFKVISIIPLFIRRVDELSEKNVIIVKNE